MIYMILLSSLLKNQRIWPLSDYTVNNRNPFLSKGHVACLFSIYRFKSGNRFAPRLSHPVHSPHAGPVLRCRAHPGLWEASAFSGTWLLTWSACGCWCSDVGCCGCDAAAARPSIHSFIHTRAHTRIQTRRGRGREDRAPWDTSRTLSDGYKQRNAAPSVNLTLFCSGYVSWQTEHPAHLWCQMDFKNLQSAVSEQSGAIFFPHRND